MSAAPIPPDEAKRLRELRDLVVLDTPPEPMFDSLARLASQVCGAPIALVSLIDSERQWFKANVGLPGVNETPRDLAFCAHAIASDELFVVPDATKDERFAGNALVTGAPDIRFYAGAPLVLPGGQRMGTLCVIDRQPRQLEAAQATMLRELGRIAAEGLVMRRDLITRSLRARSQVEQALQDSESLLQRTGRVARVGGWQLDLASGRVTWSEQTRRIHEVEPDYVPTLDTAISFYTPEARTVMETAFRHAMAAGEPWDLELPLITAKGRGIWVRAQGEPELDGDRLVRLVGALQDITERKRLEQQVAEDERFLRLLTDSLPQRIAYVDRELRYRFVNEAHLRRFGRPRGEILGRSRTELTALPMPPELQLRLQRALAGEAQRFEFEEPGQQGLRRLEATLLPDLDAQGAVRGLFTTTTDITERAHTEQSLRELNVVIENTTDFVVQADWRGNITYMNPAVRTALGLAPDEPVTGHNFSEFNTEHTNRLFREVIVPAVKERGIWLGETTVYVAGRREIPVSHMVIAHRDEDGRVARYSAVMRDISEAARARAEQLRHSATLRAVTEAVPAIVAVVGRDGVYRFVNSAFERWLGRPRDQIVGRSLLEVLGAEDLARSQAWIERVMAGESVQFERVNPQRGLGRNLAMSYTPLMLDDGTVDGFIGVGQDITQHRQEQNRLLQLSERDALTGLLNRAGFERRIEQAVRDGHGAQLALLYLDLDHFKPVNDEHGHAAGDSVLQQFAQRVQQLVRPTDAPARLGGDEFAVLLFGVREAAHAQTVANKLIVAACTPFAFGERPLQIGASVGVAFGVAADGDWRGLVARADLQLYRAKASGRGRQAGATDWVPPAA